MSSATSLLPAEDGLCWMCLTCLSKAHIPNFVLLLEDDQKFPIAHVFDLVSILYGYILSSLYLFPSFSMNRTWSWIQTTDFANQFAPVEGSMSPDARHTGNGTAQLNPHIQEWPLDCEFHDDPLASLTEFYSNDFKRCSHFAIGLEAIKAQINATEPTQALSHFTISQPIKGEPIEQPQTEHVRQDRWRFLSTAERQQEPDTVEGPKRMPTPTPTSKPPTSETRDKATDEDHRQHCREIIDKRAYYGLCGHCAFRVTIKCVVCGKKAIDMERHMKNHSEERSARCNVEGCTSRKRFSEQGLVQHRWPGSS